MPELTAVDVHAHHFGLDAGEIPARHDSDAPRLVIDGDGGGRIMRGDTTFRAVEPVLWDVDMRLAEMDRAGLSHQVVSPVPVVMEHASGADPECARSTNDSIAEACEQSGGRLLGLGCLPLGDIDAAVAELRRCREIGLHGVEVGTRIGGLDLDAPDLDRFWDACDDTASAVFVHPVQGGRDVVRRAGAPYDLGLGMLTDTAIAASALVFGGVLAEREQLRVVLAHGCGTFPWAYPRLRLAASLTGDAADRDRLARRLFVDTLVFDDEHLGLLVHRFGADRLVLGSDAPFFPDQMAKSMNSVRAAQQTGVLPEHVDPPFLARNAAELLGLATEPPRTSAKEHADGVDQ